MDKLIKCFFTRTELERIKHLEDVHCELRFNVKQVLAKLGHAGLTFDGFSFKSLDESVGLREIRGKVNSYLSKK